MVEINFILFLSFIVYLKCSSNTIENCIELGQNGNLTYCKKCKEKHFLFFHDLYCLPCDHKYYGQIGCGGNCNSSSYKLDRVVYCENKCKEGYYYLNGFCFNCDKGSPGCKKCNVTETQNQNGQKAYNYICQECLSNEYRLSEFGTCEKCKISYCLKCKFRDDNLSQECMQCEPNYYLANDGICKSCYDLYFGEGYCHYCSDNSSNFNYCYCFSPLALTDEKTCSPCIEGCIYCIANENKVPFCLRCLSGIFINENECLICPPGCNTCIIGEEGQSICTKCD